MSGCLPQNANEFVISESVAKCCHVSNEMLGTTFFLRNEEKKLVGIVKNTLCCDSINSSNEKVLDYYRTVLSDVAYLSADFWETQAEEFIAADSCITLYEADIASAVNIKKYVTTLTRVAAGVRSNGLTLGRNEIVVSSKYANDNKITLESLPKKIILSDLYSRKFATSYFDRMNLFDYLGESVYIVEIQDGRDADILLNHDVYSEIVKDNYNYFSGNFIYTFPGNKDNYYILKDMENEGIEIIDPNLEGIYQLSDGIRDYLALGVALTSFLLLLTISIYWLFLMSETGAQRTKIGVLRILGTRKNDVAYVFLIEGVLIVVSGMFLALITLCIGIVFLNVMVADKLTLSPYFGAFGLNFWTVFTAFTGLLLFFCTVTYLIVRAIGKKELFSLLHE